VSAERGMNMKKSVFGLCGIGVLLATGASGASYDVAAYVWPAYHPAERWSELGIFKDGKGEWQNQYESPKRRADDNQGAKPLWGYENEADPTAVARKIDAATAAGVNVFIYDWYWYGGRPFLEEALNEGFLKAPNCGRMKFYLMYANHDVTGLWNNRVGGEEKNKVIWPCRISDEDWKTIVARWISRYFSRPNYYKIDGRPVLSIYDVCKFVSWDGEAKAVERIAYLREEVKKAGFPDLHLQALCISGSPEEPPMAKMPFKTDSVTIYNWLYRTWGRVNDETKPMLTYCEWGERAMESMDVAKKAVEANGGVYFPNITVGWDTNARYPKGHERMSVTGSNPEDFERFARQLRDWADRNIPAGMPRLITVNSWNEWTEGTYLEPDDTFGYAYLNAIWRVFEREGKEK